MCHKKITVHKGLVTNNQIKGIKSTSLQHGDPISNTEIDCGRSVMFFSCINTVICIVISCVNKYLNVTDTNPIN